MSGNTFALYVMVAGLALAVGFALRMWYVAERDERRWRRREKEIRDAVMIREARYGSGKTRGL